MWHSDSCQRACYKHCFCQGELAGPRCFSVTLAATASWLPGLGPTVGGLREAREPMPPIPVAAQLLAGAALLGVLLTRVLGLTQSIGVDQRPDRKCRRGFIGASATAEGSESKQQVLHLLPEVR